MHYISRTPPYSLFQAFVIIKPNFNKKFWFLYFSWAFLEITKFQFLKIINFCLTWFSFCALNTSMSMASWSSSLSMFWPIIVAFTVDNTRSWVPRVGIFSHTWIYHNNNNNNYNNDNNDDDNNNNVNIDIKNNNNIKEK